MSLKQFHIVFITAAVLLSFGFAYWGATQYMQRQDTSYLVPTIISFLVAIGLIVYEVSFLKKNKD